MCIDYYDPLQNKGGCSMWRWVEAPCSQAPPLVLCSPWGVWVLGDPDATLFGGRSLPSLMMWCVAFLAKLVFNKYFSTVDTHQFVLLISAIIFLGPLHKKNLFHPWLMCSEMIACLSALLLRFHCSLLMAFLPMFKKEGMSNQAVFSFMLIFLQNNWFIFVHALLTARPKAY